MTNPILDSTLRDLLDADFAASPVAASGAGLTDYDTRLDDLSADAFRRRDADAERFLARLERIGDVAPDGELLSADDAIDRDLASAVLRGRTILAPFEGWKRDPVTYSGPVTSGLFTLFLQRLRPEADLVDAAIARLGQAGGAIDAGIANLDPDARPSADRRARPRGRAWRGALRPGPRVARRGGRAGGVSACARPAQTRRRTSSDGSPTSSDWSRPRMARGSWARSATRGSSRSARSSPTTPGRCEPAARPSWTASTARCPPWPGRHRQRGLRRGPARGRHAAPAHRAGDARDLRGLDGARTRLPRARPASSRCRRGRPARSSRHRCSSVRSSGSPRTSRRRRSPTAGRATSSSRSRPTAPPRRRSSRGCRTTRTARSRRRRSTRPTRDTTGTSSCARPTGRTCGGCTRRPTSARAGRCTPSASCASGASSTTRSRSSTT